MDIKKQLELHHMSAYEVAEKLGKPNQWLYPIINGKVDCKVSTLQSIADAIGCDMADFFEPKKRSVVSMSQYRGGDGELYTIMVYKE